MTKRAGLALVVGLSVAVACGDDHSVDPAPEPGNQSNDRISIINDDAELSARVVERSQVVDVETGVGEGRAINPTPIKIDLAAIEAGSGSAAYAVGKDGLIVTTQDGGIYWSTRDSGTDRDLTDVCFPTSLIGYVVGKRGTILATGDGGLTWRELESGTDDDLNAVTFPVGSSTGFAVGKDGRLLRTTDGGDTWVRSRIGDDMFDVVFLADALTGWVVGKRGAIRKTTDGGDNWYTQSSGTNRDLYDVTFSPDGLTGYAVGERGTLLMTTDGGATWDEGDSGNNEKIRAIAFSPGLSAGVWASEDGRVATTDDGGAEWTPAESATSRDLYDVDFNEDGSIGYAAGKSGVIMRSLDGGATWTLLAIAVSLELISEIASPVVEGSILQATSVVMKGDRAIVSYHMRGEPYLGAIDVLKIGGDGENPQLKSSATFIDTDINAVSYHDGYVFAAESTGDPAFPYPAVIEVMRLEGDRLILSDNEQMPLTSYAGTSVAADDTRIYATSGNGGHLTVFDRDTSAEVGAIALDDARWVDVDGSGLVVVAQGTPGRLAVFEADLTPRGVFPFPGADVPESNSTVELVGGKAIVAAGTAGCQVLSLETGAALADVPRPDPATIGLDPAVVVTNAVSADQDLLFISNGEAGVYLVEADDKFKDTGSEDEPVLTVLGHLGFDALQSANHVAFRKNFLIVAAGLGGVKVVRVD